MAKEPAWLTRLAQMGSTAERRTRRTSTGPASESKRIMSWRCNCGWTGSSQHLKAGLSGMLCPACGGAPGTA